jgi:hypothetical protein
MGRKGSHMGGEAGIGRTDVERRERSPHGHGWLTETGTSETSNRRRHTSLYAFYLHTDSPFAQDGRQHRPVSLHPTAKKQGPFRDQSTQRFRRHDHPWCRLVHHGTLPTI